MPASRRRSASYWLSMALLALAVAVVVGFLWMGGLFSSDGRAPPPVAVSTASAPAPGKQTTGRATDGAGADAASGNASPAAPPAAGANADAADQPAADGGSKQTTLRGLLLQGEDAQGRRFEIRAAGSRRDSEQAGVMVLRDVQGRIERPGDAVPMLFSARRALVLEDSRQAELRDDAVIRKPGRWTLQGPIFRYDPDSGDLSTDQPVTARLRDGLIEAQGGMRTENGGAVIRFRGPVRARFDETPPEKGAAAAAGDAPLTDGPADGDAVAGNR